MRSPYRNVCCGEMRMKQYESDYLWPAILKVSEEEDSSNVNPKTSANACLGGETRTKSLSRHEIRGRTSSSSKKTASAHRKYDACSRRPVRCLSRGFRTGMQSESCKCSGSQDCFSSNNAHDVVATEQLQTTGNHGIIPLVLSAIVT